MLDKYSPFHMAARACGDYFRLSRGLGVFEQITVIAHSLSWTLGLILTQVLFDAVAASTVYTNFWYIGTPLAILVLITIFQQVISGASDFLFVKASYNNMAKFMMRLQYKLSKLAAIKFEDTDFLNDIDRSKNCISNQVLGMFAYVCLRGITYYFVLFASIAVYLFYLSPLLGLVILMAFIPAVFGQIARVKLFSNLEDEVAALRRKNDYYKQAVTSKRLFNETRILGAYIYFKNLFIETLTLINKKTWKTEKKAFLMRLILNLVSIIGLVVSIILLFQATISGDISIGAFAAIFAVLSQIFSIMQDAVSDSLSKGSRYLGQVKNYYRLMDIEETKKEDGIFDIDKGVEVFDVSFSYPNRSDLAIKEVSLSIKKGETLAIVGKNGSGKTTLVRLLIGLYSPDKGIVRVAGLDTQKVNSKSIFKGVSAIFQNFQRYKMTLEKNVCISDTKKPVKKEEIIKVLDYTEFNYNNINLDTMLSPEFDGIDLSGGQWQRLSISRGIYRKSDFMVLDEPTSSIDPLEETKLYNQFRNISKDKTVVIVTHRLGLAKLADRIVVMENGKIDSIGTHTELIEKEGVYAYMYNLQAESFKSTLSKI